MLARAFVVAGFVASACTSSTATPPGESLFTTGLCVDRACTQLTPSALEYQPRFELWASTATKRRWLQLPAGAKIDTSDMDLWKFPVGTKVWKEFARDGVRVETRLIVKKLADDDATDAWVYETFEWNAEQTDAFSVPDGVTNANGTMHDIPDNKACRTCHEHLRPSRLLGVEAIQLDVPSPLLDLRDMSTMGMLSSPPSGSMPYFPLPGNATAQAALGYLHANCGSCHSTTSFVRNDTPLDLRLLTTKLASVDQTPTYRTTVNVPTLTDIEEGTIIRPRDPDNSVLIKLMNATAQPDRMPPLATEMVDPQGQATLRAWINSL